MKNLSIQGVTRHLMLAMIFVSLALLGACQKDKPTEAISTLTVQSAQTAFNVFFPNANVKSVDLSAVKGIYEVVVENQGRLGIIYMNADASYLLTGSMLEVATTNDLTTERLYGITSIDFRSVPLTNSITLGAADGKDKVIIFTAPNCEPCALYHAELKKAVQTNKDLSIYIKVLPVMALGEESLEMANSILCAKSKEEALKRLENTFNNKAIPKADCDQVKLRENMTIAANLKITGMPTTIFESGIKMNDPMPVSIFLDELKKRSK